MRMTYVEEDLFLAILLESMLLTETHHPSLTLLKPAPPGLDEVSLCTVKAQGYFGITEGYF